MKRFPSIKKNEDFKTVYSKGKSYANSLLVMYILDNKRECNRIGISASKKVGNSVIRHRMTRLVRESFRLNNNLTKQGYDIVVIVRANPGWSDYNKVKDAYINLCERHHILI